MGPESVCRAIPLAIQQASEPTSIPQELPPHAVARIGETSEPSPAAGIDRLQFSDDGKLLAARNRKNVVRIFDTVTRRQLVEVSGHENNWVQTIEFSPDSRFFLTAAGSGENVKIWNTQNGKLESEIETDASDAYFSADGTHIVALGMTDVQRYTWPGAVLIGQQKWQQQREQRAAMSRDGSLVVISRPLTQQRHQTQVLNLKTKTKIDLAGELSEIQTATISPNNLWVAASYQRADTILLWDLRDPHKSRYLLNGHRDAVQSLQFSADNRFLISSSWDKKAIVWDLLSRQSVEEFAGHTEHVNAVAISPLDFSFASGASGPTDNSILLWDLRSVLFPAGPARQQTFDQVWNRLGASLVESALAATQDLIRGQEQFLAPLAERIATETIAATTENISAAITQLNDPSFTVRESATEKLIAIRPTAETELRRMLNHTISPEVHQRITRILRQPTASPRINLVDQRRWHRIVFALEIINNPSSEKILERIATGHANIDLATDAKEALQRNQRRAD